MNQQFFMNGRWMNHAEAHKFQMAKRGVKPEAEEAVQEPVVTPTPEAPQEPITEPVSDLKPKVVLTYQEMLKKAKELGHKFDKSPKKAELEKLFA